MAELMPKPMKIPGRKIAEWECAAGVVRKETTGIQNQPHYQIPPVPVTVRLDEYDTFNADAAGTPVYAVGTDLQAVRELVFKAVADYRGITWADKTQVVVRPGDFWHESGPRGITVRRVQVGEAAGKPIWRWEYRGGWADAQTGEPKTGETSPEHADGVVLRFVVDPDPRLAEGAAALSEALDRHRRWVTSIVVETLRACGPAGLVGLADKIDAITNYVDGRPPLPKKDAVGRASEMMHTSLNRVPRAAKDYAEYLSRGTPKTADLLMVAFAHYAQAVEGLPCHHNDYRVTPEAVKWFEDNG